MRRTTTLLVLVGLLAGTAAIPARAKRPKAPRDRTFYVVGGADRFECALSADPKLADPTRGCTNDTDSPVLGAAPTWIPALDGLPLSLDVTRPIHGKVRVDSRHLIGDFFPLGAGQAQLRVTVVGVVAGEEVTVGNFTSEPYTVTPAETEHWVEFRIEPAAALEGAELADLSLGLEVLGPTAFHNFFSADGQSSMTVPLAR